MDDRDQERGQTPSKNPHDNGGDKNVEKQLLDLSKGKRPIQEPPEPDQGNPSPKKLRTTTGSSSVTGLDLDKRIELDLGLDRDFDLGLHLGSGPGGSGAKRRFGFGNFGSSSSSSVEMGGFESGSNIGVQSCLSGIFGTSLYGVKIGEPGSDINNGARNCLTGVMDHDLFCQKIGEYLSNMAGARSNPGVKVVESGHFGANHDYGATRMASEYVCECCGRPWASSRALGGHRSKCKELYEKLRREAEEAGASSAPRYVYNRARGGYVCEDCGKKFDTSHGLSKHMSKQSCREVEAAYDIHPAQNLHVCGYCGKGFDTGPALGGHTATCKKKHRNQGGETKEAGEDDEN